MMKYSDIIRFRAYGTKNEFFLKKSHFLTNQFLNLRTLFWDWSKNKLEIFSPLFCKAYLGLHMPPLDENCTGYGFRATSLFLWKKRKITKSASYNHPMRLWQIIGRNLIFGSRVSTRVPVHHMPGRPTKFRYSRNLDQV